MEFRLLGPVEVEVGGQVRSVGTRLQQAVFAVLLDGAGRRVPVETLLDRVWGDSPPAKAPRDVLYSYVSRLRRVLSEAAEAGGEAPPRIESGSAGYVLQVDRDAVDLHRFRRLVDSAGGQEPARQATILAQAMVLWRGTALAGIEGEWAVTSRTAWRQEWLAAVTGWASAKIAGGRPEPVLATLPAVAAEFPFAEPVEALLVRALHASGHRAEALNRYAAVRRRLTEELGVEPGLELRSAQAAVLQETSPAHSGQVLMPADPSSGVRRSTEAVRSRDRASGPAGTAAGETVARDADPDRSAWTAPARGGAEHLPLAPDPAPDASVPAAARALAWRVAEQEASIQQRLLADTGDVRPADVGFAQPSPAELRWRTDGGDRDGSLATIAEFYRSLDRGRLVILGEPGAGKTVMAIQVLLDLIRTSVMSTARNSGRRTRVPVRLSLPAFPADVGADVVPAVVRRRLDSWIAGQLVAGYGQRPSVARQLVDGGWILPILDGLDEMDPDDADPVRAKAVVAALNQPTGAALRPAVVTCRTELYEHLLSAHSPTGVPDVPQDTTVVVMQPMTAEQVIRWLTHRFPDPTRVGGVAERWQPVIAELIAQPRGRLARCLASPLRCYLAVTAYRDPATTPAELCTISPENLDRHLFARLIPAVTAHHPGPDGRRYGSQDVTRWLATFAEHLARMRRSGRSGTDLRLQDLWRSTGGPERPGRAVRWSVAVLYALLPAPLLPLAGRHVAAGAHGAPGVWFTWIGLASGVAFTANTVRSVLREESDPRRLDFAHLRTRIGRARLAGWLAAGLLGGLLTGLVVSLAVPLALGPAAVLALGCIVGLSAGLVAGLLSGLGSRPVAIDRPSRVVSQGLAYDLTTMLVVGFAFGLTVGPWFGLTFGLAFGLACGLLRRAGSPWPRYGLTVWTMWRSGRLPGRPAAFLDWACAAGLLRLSGAAVQFRHRELQNSLATRPPPTPPPVQDERRRTAESTR